MNAEQFARMSSPTVVAALVLLAEVRHESLVAYVAEASLPPGGRFINSTALDSAATMLVNAIAIHVANGYPLAPKADVDMGASVLGKACSAARVSVASRLAAVSA